MALPATTADSGTWIGDQVNYLLKDGDDLFVAGSGPVCPNTGGLIRFNKTDGNLYSDEYYAARANFGAAVRTIVSDGSGGWYVGGDFTEILGESRQYLARINSDGTLNEWNPNPDLTVNTLAVADGVLYVGGQFTTIAETSRLRAAAFTISTGELTSFAPNVASGYVNAIVPDAAGVYLGGLFSSVNSVTRNGVALVTGAAGTTNAAWNPNLYKASGSIICYSIAVTAGAIYIGGAFDRVGGSLGAIRSCLAAVDTSGAVTAWNPSMTGTRVRSILVGDSTIYVGGLFTSAGGQTRRALAELSIADGTATSLAPEPYYTSSFGMTEVFALALDSGVLYYAGMFNQVGGSTGDPANYAASVVVATGVRGDWEPVLSNTASVIAIDTDSVLVGGSFTRGGGVATTGLTKFDATTGQAQDWNTPIIGSNIWAVCVSADTIYIGGDFSSIGGTTRTRIAALDRTTGELLSWYPTDGANGRITALKMTDDGNYIFAAGNFTSIGGVTTRVAKISVADASVEDWDGGLAGSSTINDLLISGDYLYVANANTLKAPIHIETGEALAGFIACDTSNNIMSLAVSGDTLFVGGAFDEVYHEPDFTTSVRQGLFAVDKLTGEVLDWATDLPFVSLSSSKVLKVVTDAEYVYIATETDPTGEYPTAAAFDLTTGLEAWRADIGDSSWASVYALEVGSIYLGGDFETVDGSSQYGFAMYTSAASDGDGDGDGGDGGDGGDADVLDLVLATYRVDFVDNQQFVALTDELGVTRFYNNGDTFQGPEYFDQYTTGEGAFLTKLTDSIENGEFVSIDIPTGDGLSVLVHGKRWNLLNTSEVMITVSLYNATFRVGPGQMLLFPMTTDPVLTHASGSTVSVKMYIL